MIWNRNLNVYYYSLILRSLLNPRLPSWKQDTQVLWVGSFLNEMVHLPTNTERYTILYPFQLLLQPNDNPLSHLVEVRVRASLVGVCCLEDVSIGSCVGSRCVVTLFSAALKVESFQRTQSPLV